MAGGGEGGQMQLVREWRGAQGYPREGRGPGPLASAGKVLWRKVVLSPAPGALPSPRASLSLCPSPSMMEYSLDGHNVSLSAIRTVRVLRPLRAINRVPSE